MSTPDGSDEQFPASKLERGKIFAKTGLKVGSNYARYLKDRITKRDEDPAAQRRALNDQNAKDLYKEFTKLRGTALKLAQGLSMDTGMLPEEFMDVMAEAQYRVPPMNRALVRKRIRDGLGRYPEQVFDAFDGEALAAASIGQVHRARLEDGTPVAVKVQYPNVRDTIASDLALARTLFKRFVRGPNLDAYFSEVREKLLEETDYLNEAENIAFFAEQYDHDSIVTPHPIRAHTAETVLTMTFVEGQHLDAFMEAPPRPATRHHFGQVLWDFMHEQVASNHRTLHADAHPGNFLFRDDGRLGVIDFGCVKTFPQDFRDDMLRLYRARMDDDADAIERFMYALDILHDDMKPSTRDDMRAFFDRFGTLIVAPYRTDTFDFGSDDFHEELRACFRAASELREATGSHHFIFINKVLVGLFNLLGTLEPTIDTTRSRTLLRAAVDEIEERTGHA
jgi:predicted unusual protein kinase regulating ubiquinone biosynthesis (AarF/ABC1/UbiB family)